MNATWLRLLTFALALTGCSSDGKDVSEPIDAGPKRDAAIRDARGAPEDEPPEEEPPEEAAEEVERDAERPRDAAQDASRDAGQPEQDVHPRCAPRDSGIPGFNPGEPPPGFLPDDVVATHDGVIFTTAGAIAKIPGRGRVFGRMEGGNCIVTVAETGVSTTIFGEGDVCIHGQLVASMGKCLVDADGEPVP